VNKARLISELATRLGWTKAQSEEVITCLLDDTGIIADALAAGEKVSLPGFGIFEAKPSPARIGRHPQTGEPVQILAHRRPAFRAGQALKDRVYA
jgi:DNA-binding protein HU-beta